MSNLKVRQFLGSEPEAFYGYIVVAAAFCIMLAMWGSYIAFGVFFKPVSTDFGWSRAMTSVAFSLAMAVQGVLAIAMGAITDRLGPRIILTLCGLLVGVGYLLMSQISAVWQLYLFYGMVIGIGMSGHLVPVLSTIARWFVAKRSMITGVVLAGGGMGTLTAPLLANQLISAYGWRTSYIIMGSIVLVTVALAAQFLRRDPAQMRQVPYGENVRTEKPLKIEAEVFSLRESVGTRQFWLVFAIFICLSFCKFAVMVHIVSHATDLGLSATTAASIVAVLGALDIAGRVVLGNVADRIGNRQVFIIAFVVISAAFFWLAPAKESWMLYLFAAVYGFVHAGAGAASSPLVAGFFGLRSHGLIFGVIGLGLTIGGTVGPFLAGYIFDVFGNYRVAWLVCAGISVVGLVLTTLLKPTARNVD